MKSYELYVLNNENAKVLLNTYSCDDYTYDQVLAIMQALDQSLTYSIEKTDGSNSEVLF